MTAIYAAFDPGKRTGVATWDAEGKSLVKTVLLPPELDQFLEAVRLMKTYKVFIIEKYQIYQQKLQVHAGSQVETAQTIGQIKAVARVLGIEVVMQPATVLGIASMWSGVKKRGKHWPDEDSAYNHGYYYLHQNGVIKARVLES